MTQEDPHQGAAEPILDRLHRLMSTATVFGDPIEHDGLTVIPAARVVAGGGGGRGVDQGAQREGDGGGAGLLARPAGALVINDGRVIWKPAITVESVATLVLLAIIWLARRR
ncbi:MAG: spore germination protein GerW family protein [Acidimicrobiia bacterium]|nr:spore germination protein GerW family protein [Acidimicrobiia bacterium]